jgi:cytochrome P450 family 4 subfamily B polypeptide 1
MIYNALIPWLGRGLLVANGARWARSRRLLTPAFHFDILRPYAGVFTDCSRTLVGEWSKVPEGQSFNVFPCISLLTLDVMLRCTCSYDSHCQTNKTHDPYIKSVFDLSTLTTRRILFFPAYYDWVYALMPDGFRYRRACKTVHEFSRDVVQQRRKALEDMKRNGTEKESTNKRKYLDFIDILLEARVSSNKEEVHGNFLCIG